MPNPEDTAATVTDAATQPATGDSKPAEPAAVTVETIETTPAKPTKPNGENGFPTETPIAEMSVEQREAYWKFQSKKHESAEEKARTTASEQATQLADTLRENAKLKLQRTSSVLTDDVFDLAPENATAEQLTDWGTKMAAVLTKAATPAASVVQEPASAPKPTSPSNAELLMRNQQPRSTTPGEKTFDAMLAEYAEKHGTKK